MTLQRASKAFFWKFVSFISRLCDLTKEITASTEDSNYDATLEFDEFVAELAALQQGDLEFPESASGGDLETAVLVLRRFIKFAQCPDLQSILSSP